MVNSRTIVTSDHAAAILDRAKEFFASRSNVVMAWAYGSLVDGRLRETSDLDFAFFADRIVDLDTRLEWIEELQRLFARRVDLVDLNQTKGLIVKEVLTTGTMLKNADPDRYAAFLSRFYIDEADYGPIRDRAIKERLEAVFGKPAASDDAKAKPKI
jgi:predicted nucleotidyltransferase